MPELIPGLYERLLTVELRRLVSTLQVGQAEVSPPDAADAHTAVADHLRRIIEGALHAVPEDERLTRQAEICNALLACLKDEQPSATIESEHALVVPLAVLREVRALSRGAALATPTSQPLVPLSSADLMVNARGEPSVGAAIEREIHSADRIDLVCAFIRWNGLRTLRPALEGHRQAGRPIRVITTVYTGSTERRALDWLVSIGAEVKVSYDTQTTRLHAKAWLFERLTGFSTAFIGSSNLTHSALLDGVEWNVRLAQASTPELIEKFKAAFESYWADPDYERYEPARDAARFDRAVRAPVAPQPSPIFHFDLQPWPFQREMLQRLETERERHHRHRNLVVAATGTGKTLVASAIANELGMDLYRVDLSRIMSKWIGETEQNLAKLFDAAEDGHAIILFDEADSLFAKRTEVRSSNDRYANLEVNYLLQRMESYDGVTLLATNLEQGIDEAFKRRVRFTIAFDIPEPPVRASLWRSMFPPEAPLAADVDWQRLAEKFEMAGGYIKKAAIRAAARALARGSDATITAADLELAALLEYREMGRVV